MISMEVYETTLKFSKIPKFRDGRKKTLRCISAKLGLVGLCYSMSSALWVCWGLLCGHLVAFKAPKSWPNKFLINVWGGFSVIFVASYTANIAALIAGLFFHNAVGDYHDRSVSSHFSLPASNTIN